MAEGLVFLLDVDDTLFDNDAFKEALRAEATRLLGLYDPKSAEKKRFPLLPAYDQVLKCSNLFNTLDARGAISVTERVGVIQRVRKMAVGVAHAWVDQGTEALAEVTQ